MRMREYFFKALFGLWLFLKSLFVGCVTGLALAVLVSFSYYYVYGHMFNYWAVVTAILIAAISIFWLCADYKQTMATAVKVSKMDNDEIISQLIFWVIVIVVLMVVCLALYGAYRIAV